MIDFRLKMIDFARVQKELVECRKDAEGSGILVIPKSDNLALLNGTIPGPLGTPYEGGIFQIDITIPGTNRFPFLYFANFHFPISGRVCNSLFFNHQCEFTFRSFCCRWIPI